MFRALISLVSLFLAASCGGLPPAPVSDVLSFDTPSVLPRDFSPEKYLFVKELNTKSSVVFFYQDHEGYTHYYNGKEDKIINREVMDKYKKLGAVPMDMSYGYDGHHLYFSQPVRWGPKKLIFIKLEPSGKVVYTKELSTLQEVLKPASMAFDGKGGMLLTWVDETAPYMKGIYLLVKGDSFSGKEQVISYPDEPVLTAQAVKTDKGLAVVYVRTRQQGSSEIRARFLADGSERVLYSGTLSDFDLIESKGGFLLRPYQSSSKATLVVFNSSFDRVKEYTVAKPKELGESLSLYHTGSLVSGEPFVLGTGSPAGNVEVDGYQLPQKLNLYYSYAGREFERVSGGRPFMFTSAFPSVESSDKHAVVVYTDRRFAAPSVMAAVFDGAGKILKRDVVMEKPGVHTGNPRVTHLGGDVFRVFYPVEDKDGKAWIYRAKDIKADGIDSLYGILSVRDRKGLLTETAEKYADCRKKGDSGCVYDMLDPVYRSGVSKAVHTERMQQTGVVVSEFKYEDCKILEESVLAACNGYVVAKLPTQIFGKPIKESERDVAQRLVGDIWIFHGGKWYYVVSIPMLGYALQW